LTFKDKGTIGTKMMFDYDNCNENTANPENRFRIQYFNVMVSDIKSNLHTRFESFAEFVDKFGFVFEVWNLKKNVERTFETFPRFENPLISKR
jgi:hypothetical protein